MGQGKCLWRMPRRVGRKKHEDQSWAALPPTWPAPILLTWSWSTWSSHSLLLAPGVATWPGPGQSEEAVPQLAAVYVDELGPMSWTT